MNEGLENVESILYEALRLADARERVAYLEAACGIGTPLRADVDSLLRAYEGQAGILKAPDRLLEEPADSVSEGPGTVVGRYKLLEKIGEGGMAVVYMAEQEQPIRRKVALKIIKLGMDTRQVIARFEAERQALALMDHPSIAKVLDAGATETGRPYFVMELVTGVSITEYCDKNSLSTKDRLALFLQVCQAVQHAHQKGIIHRDIKPSNVMVTHHDGKPVPKVIDFGIAKATNQKLTEKTLFTRYAHLIGTPAYMSPEQAELSDLDIDTRSDIYSLGVLLYELLTGTTPFSEEELRKAGYIEMQRIIREQEPVKPSTRIRTATRERRSVGAGPRACPTLGGHRGPPLRKADREMGGPGSPTSYQQVRGDLDWIVMKSLEKDRARRYETASGLAEDVRRHLEHEPVVARGPSTTYCLQKLLRRHRSHVIAGLAMAVVAGAAVVVLSMWGRDRLQLAEAEGLRHGNILSQAREQYAKAEREAAMETLKPILSSKHVGPEARLLQAGILVDNRRSDEAVNVLNGLLQDRLEIAGAAHALLARILWESESPNAEKLKEIEEHRQQAEALLPEMAEAYFLRAMTAVTIKEQLAALDKALQLDASHYESRRLRAFTYYASRKYEKMKDDALVLTVVRPRDPVGYSLRAIAFRELGKQQEAIAEYDTAIALTPKEDPEYVNLTVQRSEVFLRMGDYERVVAEAPVDMQNLAPLRYHVFAALTALGDYEKASGLFRQIISPGQNAQDRFQDWCSKYVFDTLEDGRSWHPPEREPLGVAFLPMVEADESWHQLSAKARRVITDGFTANWSPDGKRLAFSLGVRGRSGVAVFDPATKETELLIVPGKDPRWSPDGKYIAFVRDCQFLRVSEVLDIESRNPRRWQRDEEVWVMNADGTEPRRLVRGGWPSWSGDSMSIYYHSRVDRALYSISIVNQNAQPERIMACSDFYPSVSPDNQYAAYLEDASLKIKDLASETVVAEWPVPFVTWGGIAWSPAGRELCLAGNDLAKDRTGLWIYGFDRSQAVKVLSGQIVSASWSPMATDLAFNLGLPYSEIWAAHLNPKVSTVKSLGPGRTLEEHGQEVTTLYTRRIKADPTDADAYLRRAQQNHYLHQEARVRADMRCYTAIMTQGASSNSQFGKPSDADRAINGPFGYQLAFSVGRRDNGIQVLCVAFGQKGRCEMKVFEVPMCIASVLGLSLLIGLDAPPAYADFTFGEPVRVASGVASDDDIDCFSYDGLEMYIDSVRAGGQGARDIWVLKRASKDEDWGPPENLQSAVNSTRDDIMPCISADGLALYFGSNRLDAANSRYDIFVATRAAKNDPWGQAVRMGPEINGPGGVSCRAWISADNLELYIDSVGRAGAYSVYDIYVARRLNASDPWSEAVSLGPVVNTKSSETLCSLSPDGLLLLFSAHFGTTGTRPGSYGLSDLWMARRASLSDPWQTPVNLGPTVNGPASEWLPRISPDGRTLYFGSSREGGGNWQAPIIPIVDFNGDGKVDLVDLVMLIDNWGTNQTLCDIGPMSWGDGKVDIEDLKVFMTEWEKENPPAQP